MTKALGFDAEQPDLDKYWEDQPRIPAGHGRQSGQWTNAITVAMNEGPPENEEERKEDHVLPRGRPHVMVGGRIFDLNDGMLAGAGPGDELVRKAVQAAAQAKENVGTGRGPVYGTAVHTEFKRIIGEMKDPAMRAEQS